MSTGLLSVGMPSNSRALARRQGIFWIGTIPHASYTPYPNTIECQWIRGQLEQGETGYLHWQIMVAFTKKKTLRQVREIFGESHFELSRSEAAAAYCWKEETRVEGTQFEFGAKPIQRNSHNDWEAIWLSAQRGSIMEIPPAIRFQSYRTIRSIQADFAEPPAMERTTNVYWGPTGTGKSRTAWDRAGMDAYSKDPRTKFWCGYRGQRVAVIDEFRGSIDISHMLRWLDRYPVVLEIKGSSHVHCVETFYITSNLHPKDWYPDLDELTLSALYRKINITHFDAL